MSSVTVSMVVFACVFGGALVGTFASSVLPSRHSNSDSKEAVRLGMGLVATTAAIALGLLIASAKSFYDTQNADMTQMAANVILLDRVLAHYGPEAKEARALLRNSVARMTNARDSGKVYSEPRLTNEDFLDKLQGLSPQNDIQRSLQTQALSLAIQIAQTHWLMYEQQSTPVPSALLVILVFWLTVLFISFGLFVRPNVIVVGSLFISASAVSGAIFLIIAMYQPYAGLIRVSGAPLRAALAQLGQ